LIRPKYFDSTILENGIRTNEFSTVSGVFEHDVQSIVLFIGNRISMFWDFRTLAISQQVTVERQDEWIR